MFYYPILHGLQQYKAHLIVLYNKAIMSSKGLLFNVRLLSTL